MPTTAIVSGGQDKEQQIVTTIFINAVKQYLCLSLSRNVVSVVPAIFECALDIFWKILSGLRNYLKKEIEVFFKEVFLPVLEMKNSSFQQRQALLNTLLKVCSEPQLLVEIYLNYDCDGEALDNIYERLVNVLGKITTTIVTGQDQAPPAQHVERPLTKSTPSLTSASVSQSLTSAHSHISFANEVSLKKKSLETLVAILHSLVEWSSRSFELEENEQSKEVNTNDENRSGNISPHPSVDSGSFTLTPSVVTTVSEPPALTNDDPEQFHNQKFKKQMLQEGIRMFAWKPKRVITFY